MKDKFNITGYFYTIDDLKFRKYLNIKLKTSSKEKPDLMVIMMNPGSSYPINKIDNFRDETETKPDNTQDQIMSVMDVLNFEYARILNLSDIRISQSQQFYKFLDDINTKNTNHSIFDDARINEFEELFQKEVPVILAWGVHKKLNKLAKKAYEKIGNSKIYGIAKGNENIEFYHPLPRMKKDRDAWVGKIITLF